MTFFRSLIFRCAILIQHQEGFVQRFHRFLAILCLIAAPCSATVIASAEISVLYTITAPSGLVIEPESINLAEHDESAGSLGEAEATAIFDPGLGLGSANANVAVLALPGGFAEALAGAGTEFLFSNPTNAPLTVTFSFLSLSASAAALADPGDLVEAAYAFAVIDASGFREFITFELFEPGVSPPCCVPPASFDIIVPALDTAEAGVAVLAIAFGEAAVIPEPSAAVLIPAGLIIVALVRRRAR
jgi:hypothetical protein